THNLIKMAREGLAFELRNAIHKAKKEQVTVTKENISVNTRGKQYLVTIEIIPLTDTVDIHYLIQFTKNPLPAAAEEIIKSTSSSQKIKNDISQKRYEQLEKELSHTREDMRSVTEDMEATNEELQSANEELQSSNEEMQSLNEELETSKEELQSSNEELIIVNQELLDKQEQLNMSRFYSEAIVTTMREPLVVLDKTLRVKTANASFYTKFNVDEKETEGKLFYELQNHQFDDNLLRSLLEKILPQKNRIEDFEINLRLPGKGERIILLNARQIVNEKRAEQLILLALEDITDRVHSEKLLKESEARSRTFVESNVVAVCFTHLETATIFEANKAFLNMLGYTRQDLKTGKINWLNYTPPEHQVNDHLAIEKAKSMKISPPYEKEIIRTDGKRISVIKARAIINKNEIMSVFVDITERKSAELKLKTFAQELETKVKERTAELQTSNEELRQSNMHLDQFAYVASHDLQEPLRKILTFTMRLQDKHADELTPEAKSYITKIEGASGRMRILIQDLLNYSRLLQHETLFKETDLSEILKNVLSDFELLIQEKKAEIKTGQLPTIAGIPLQLNQLFYNLINNSLKFSKKEVPPVISITSRTLSEKEITKYPALDPSISYVEIIFKDNGIGFEQQYAKRIFSIFQRLHDKDTFTGTGIGLALTRKIIENHHGDIFADAKENQGAAFHVILPITQPR
ncbi:MAG: PAS domain-containing protein, partial [Chitinophagaceae bacterium]